MVSTKDMKKSQQKNIRVYYTDGTSEEIFCEEYFQAEDEEDEPMLFYGGNGALPQSMIEKIEILD